MTPGTAETSGTPAVLAARTLGRWALVAGVTGFIGNIALAIMFATPGNGPWGWAGPASDIIGVPATLALIPLALGLLAICGNGPGLGAITSLAVIAMAGMAIVSLALVLGLIPFSAEVAITYLGMTVLFGWVLAVSRAGRASGCLPRQVAGWGVVLGGAGAVGSVLLLVSAPMAAGSLASTVTFGAGAVAAAPVWFAFPVWLIVLSYRLPAQLAASAGSPVRQPEPAA
jgi:hypothetical protein